MQPSDSASAAALLAKIGALQVCCVLMVAGGILGLALQNHGWYGLIGPEIAVAGAGLFAAVLCG